MPTFKAAYTVPKPNTTEISEGARAAFQNEEAALLSGLGLRDGGFQANADRVVMLDDTGKLVTPPPYDARMDNGMTAAAQAGRLFVMDKDYRLRQVRLEGNEDDGFAFMATNPLNLSQLPRLSMNYFLKRFEAIFSDFKRDISQIYNETMSKMSEHFNKDSMSRIFGGRNKENEPAELGTNAEQQMSKDAPLETQQTGTTLEEEQIRQSQIKPWKYQAQDTRNMSNEVFFDHVKAAYNRGDDLNVAGVLTGEDCTPEAYYEVLTQKLEAKVAGEIFLKASNAATNEERNKFLDAHKAVYTSMVVGLGDYVVNNTNKADLAEHCSHPEERSDAYHALSKSADEIVRTGVFGYTRQLNHENASNEQAKQQEQPNNEVTLKNEEPQTQKEINPFVRG